MLLQALFLLLRFPLWIFRQFNRHILRRIFKRHQRVPRYLLILWLLVGLVMGLFLPDILDTTRAFLHRVESKVSVILHQVFPPYAGNGEIAPFFTGEVQHWSGRITKWAEDNGLDNNLMATVMQIESCGHPTIASRAGAQGLFQVMPFHFAVGENMLDPDTNAQRSANFLNECSRYSGNDPGLTLACYNGGPSVVNRQYSSWTRETQRYYVWGLSIYNDAIQQKTHSDSLDQWLTAGGSNLCRMASQELGLR